MTDKRSTDYIWGSVSLSKAQNCGLLFLTKPEHCAPSELSPFGVLACNLKALSFLSLIEEAGKEVRLASPCR